MRYLFALAIAISLTMIWQIHSLEESDADLKSVGHEEVSAIPPQTT